MKVGITYHRFFDDRGEERCIGGIETYIVNLGTLLTSHGYDVTLFQGANAEFINNSCGFRVVGVNTSQIPVKSRPFAYFKAASEFLNEKEGILIFGADYLSVPNSHPRTIAIQHGVCWDCPKEITTKSRLCAYRPIYQLVRWTTQRKQERYACNSQIVVCVDYNYVNWYRAVTTSSTSPRFRVVINATHIPVLNSVDDGRYRSNENVRVLVARRFTKYRGVLLVADVCEDILRRYPNISFTYAGEGPEEATLRRRFEGHERVEFRKYLPEQALDFVRRYHISVVPSLGSEGSSLSLAEAMACGCAVIATNVGGMTNMIIDGYNGLLCSPDFQGLRGAFEKLLRNSGMIATLGRNAHETAKAAFCLDRWKATWLEIIEDAAAL